MMLNLLPSRRYVSRIILPRSLGSSVRNNSTRWTGNIGREKLARIPIGTTLRLLPPYKSDPSIDYAREARTCQFIRRQKTRQRGLSRRVCDNRKAGNPPSATLPTPHPPSDSMQSMSSGGGDGATSARINPALRRIFFIPVLSRSRLALIPHPSSPLSFRASRYPTSSSLSLSLLPLFSSLSPKASLASKYCGERIKRQSRFVAPITFEMIVGFPFWIPTAANKFHGI